MIQTIAAPASALLREQEGGGLFCFMIQHEKG